MEIGAQMRRAVILHLRPILKTSKLKIKMQIEVKWYIFLSVQQLRQTATLKRKLRRQTGLLNTSLDDLVREPRVHLFGDAEDGLLEVLSVEETLYRVVQLNLTTEIEVFHMLFKRYLSHFTVV